MSQEKVSKTGIRLQKILAQAGIASRRASEVLIKDGKISVNGKIVTELGVRANPDTDVIEVEGVPIDQEDLNVKSMTILLNKPRGVMCTAHDPEGRQTVFDLLGEELPRLFTVGRLDYNTEGAILLTNDGQMANRLSHPKYHVAKTYHVKVQGRLSIESVKALRQGVFIDGRRTLPADVSELGSIEKNIWYEVVLVEGRNRQIHRMMEAVGARVSRLKRVQYGNLTLEGVKVGNWRPISKREIEGLLTGAPAVNSPAPPQPRAPQSEKEKKRSRSSSSRRARGPASKADQPGKKRRESRRKPDGYSRSRNKDS